MHGQGSTSYILFVRTIFRSLASCTGWAMIHWPKHPKQDQDLHTLNGWRKILSRVEVQHSHMGLFLWVRATLFFWMKWWYQKSKLVHDMCWISDFLIHFYFDSCPVQPNRGAYVVFIADWRPPCITNNNCQRLLLLHLILASGYRNSQ